MQDTINTVAALKEGMVTMQAEAKKIDMDNIEDLYDEMAIMTEDMEEVQECMGRSYNCEF